MHKGDLGSIENGRVRIQGTSYGYGDANPYLIHRGQQHLLIQKKGTQDWYQRGASGHFPAQWYLVHVEWLKKKDHFKVLAVVDQKEPGLKWRAARQELLAKLTQLETKTIDTSVSAAEMKMLERAFAAEVNFQRFQSKSKLIAGMVEKGLLIPREEDEKVFGSLTMHVEWYELTHLGRFLYCATCDDVDLDDEP